MGGGNPRALIARATKVKQFTIRRSGTSGSRSEATDCFRADVSTGSVVSNSRPRGIKPAVDGRPPATRENQDGSFRQLLADLLASADVPCAPPARHTRALRHAGRDCSRRVPQRGNGQPDRRCSRLVRHRERNGIRERSDLRGGRQLRHLHPHRVRHAGRLRRQGRRREDRMEQFGERLRPLHPQRFELWRPGGRLSGRRSPERRGVGHRSRGDRHRRLYGARRVLRRHSARRSVPGLRVGAGQAGRAHGELRPGRHPVQPERAPEGAGGPPRRRAEQPDRPRRQCLRERDPRRAGRRGPLVFRSEPVEPDLRPEHAQPALPRAAGFLHRQRVHLGGRGRRRRRRHRRRLARPDHRREQQPAHARRDQEASPSTTASGSPSTVPARSTCFTAPSRLR